MWAVFSHYLNKKWFVFFLCFVSHIQLHTLFSSVCLNLAFKFRFRSKLKTAKKRTTDWVRSSDGAATHHSTNQPIANKMCYQLEYRFSNLNVFFFKSLSRSNLVSASNIAGWYVNFYSLLNIRCVFQTFQTYFNFYDVVYFCFPLIKFVLFLSAIEVTLLGRSFW